MSSRLGSRTTWRSTGFRLRSARNWGSSLPATAAAVFLAVPLLAMLVRVPWGRVPALLSTPAAVDALWLSLRTCTLTVVVSLVLGLPLALVLSRTRGRWAAWGRVLATVPMVLPPFVGAIGVMQMLGPYGSLNALLGCGPIDWLGPPTSRTY